MAFKHFKIANSADYWYASVNKLWRILQFSKFVVSQFWSICFAFYPHRTPYTTRKVNVWFPIKNWTICLLSTRLSLQLLLWYAYSASTHYIMSSDNKRSSLSTAPDFIELNYPAENVYYIEKIDLDEVTTVEISDPSSPSGKRISKAFNTVAIDLKGNRVVIEAWTDSGIATQKYLR